MELYLIERDSKLDWRSFGDTAQVFVCTSFVARAMLDQFF
uniref:Uncharacterized protein n=1 Tax=Arundo donax TaxID=35708 RepID=A0A0A9GAD8_ARUDO